jgi:inner membrane protein
MDNLTHSLTGVMLSRAGLRRLTPHATLTLLLAVNAPDADIVSLWGGQLNYLHYHRGITHAIPAWPLMAGLVTVLVAALIRLWPEGRGAAIRWGGTYLVALAGVASHTLMDFTNTYGIRPWLPFSSQWFSWDICFIVDAWILAALLLALAAPAVARLISSEIGARPGAGGTAAVLALLFIVGWWGVRDVMRRRALTMLAERLYGFDPRATAAGSEAVDVSSALHPPLRVAAFSDPVSPFLWRGFVETEVFYQLLDVDVRRPLDPASGKILYQPEQTPVVAAALRSPTAVEFSAFARYRYARVDHREQGYRVVLSDFRFQGERRNAFRCVIDLDQGLKVTSEKFSF